MIRTSSPDKRCQQGFKFNGTRPLPDLLMRSNYHNIIKSFLSPNKALTSTRTSDKIARFYNATGCNIAKTCNRVHFNLSRPQKGYEMITLFMMLYLNLPQEEKVKPSPTVKKTEITKEVQKTKPTDEQTLIPGDLSWESGSSCRHPGSGCSSFQANSKPKEVK